MRNARPILLMLLASLALGPACGRPRVAQSDNPPPVVEFLVSRSRPDVLIITETEGPSGSSVAAEADALETLIAHFDLGYEATSAQHYEPGMVRGHKSVFYLSGKPNSNARTRFIADLESYDGIVTWVGPGVRSLGPSTLKELGLKDSAELEALPEAAEWSLSYRGQSRLERIPIAAASSTDGALVIAAAHCGNKSAPFICGKGLRWYVAAGPSLASEHFWSACIWADALHDILGQAHAGEPKRLVPVLRDAPVWATADQVPNAVRQMLTAGSPVAIMAWTNWGDVPLADRPEAVKGLAAAEGMGATVALAANSALDAREHFRLAWEVGLHPVAWAGPSDGENPFRLHIASPDGSPPFSAGGLLPAPIAISDAGYIASEDTERLVMLRVVRDAVALASFGLWAPPKPFQDFVEKKQASGWTVSDVRYFGVRVEDNRRTLISGVGQVQVPGRTKVRQLAYSRDWKLAGEKIATTAPGASATLSVTSPPGGVTVVELLKQMPARDFVKGITLDPWAYIGSHLSAKQLAAKLAERYRENGVNAVFLYAYNVEQGAAYQTRYRGATISEWGQQDLLKEMIDACHGRGIRVVAWMYSGRDRAMWKNHPDWRERTKDGKEYNPLRLHAAYFLCPRNPEVREWYQGLLGDLGRRYPGLDGIELCEPVVNWFADKACYCEVCNREFAKQHPGELQGGSAWRRFRSAGMTEFLSGCMKAIGEQGVDSCIMTLSDAWSNGAILSPRKQADECGLDMEAILDGPNPPDWVNYEIIWQQWAAQPQYGTRVFNYDWAEQTARRLARRTDGRARVLFHIELTDFGSQRMTPVKMAQTIERVKAARPNGIECYHSYAMDSRGAWPALKQSYEALP